MRLLFMGTPDFSVTILKSLHEAGHEILACYTQPDRPQGRGEKLQAPPVKIYAQTHDIPCLQPTDLKSADVCEELQAFHADIVVVAAYGRILPKDVLNIYPDRFINIHASLLPTYRGAAPIQWAIRNGDSMTGISLMRMEEGMDTGSVYVSEALPIDPNETTGSLFVKCADLGAEMIVKYLPMIVSGDIQAIPQNEAEATYAPMFSKEDERIDWRMPAKEIIHLNHAYLPETGTYTVIGGERLKILSMDFVSNHMKSDSPGRIVEVTKHDFSVATGQGVVRILRVQPAGKKAMDVASYLNGRSLTTDMYCNS